MDPINLLIASPLVLVALAGAMHLLERYNTNKLRVQRSKRTFRALNDAHDSYMKGRF